MEERTAPQNPTVLTRSEIGLPAWELFKKSQKSSEPFPVIVIHLQEKYQTGVSLPDEDRVLRIALAAVQRIMRKSDLVCHWDHRNLVILLPPLPSEALLSVSNKLTGEVGNALESYTFNIQIRTKTATLPDTIDSADGLLKHIDSIIEE